MGFGKSGICPVTEAPITMLGLLAEGAAIGLFQPEEDQEEATGGGPGAITGMDDGGGV